MGVGQIVISRALDEEGKQKKDQDEADRTKERKQKKKKGKRACPVQAERQGPADEKRGKSRWRACHDRQRPWENPRPTTGRKRAKASAKEKQKLEGEENNGMRNRAWFTSDRGSVEPS